MDTRSKTGRAAAPALALLLALASLSAACRREAQPGAERAAAQAGATPQGAGASAKDAAALDADIERLERQAERNPADQETRVELARAYVRRGDALRSAGKLAEALADYQSALRNDEDNAEAQGNAAAINAQLGGAEQVDENGAPVPLPITPGVADEGGRPTPTPKKP